MFPNENAVIYGDQSYAFQRAGDKNSSWVVQPMGTSYILRQG